MVAWGLCADHTLTLAAGAGGASGTASGALGRVSDLEGRPAGYICARCCEGRGYEGRSGGTGEAKGR